MRSRTFALLAAALLLVAALPLALGALAAPATADYAVHGPDAAATLEALGVEALDYGAFATARMTPADATALAGFTVVRLSHETGRGLVRFDGASGDAAVPADLRAGTDSGVYLVQFTGPVRSEWRAALDAAALAVYDYVPHDSFIARMTPASAAAFAERDDVLFLGAYHPAYKIEPGLPATGDVALLVVAYEDRDFTRLLADLARVGTVTSHSDSSPWENVLRLTVDASRVADVARHLDVYWLELARDEATTDNAQSTAITQTGATGNWRVSDLGVNGSSQVASVCDTGSNTNGLTAFSMVHEMFADPTQTLTHNVANPAHRKVLLYYSPIEGGVRGDRDDSDGHGTHTSGTLGGNAGAAARDGNDGFAFAGKLAICDITIGGSFQILNDYANYWNPAYDVGARVNSNSWGSAHTNAYTEKARQHDAYVWTHRDMNILRSMGNTGPSGNIRPEAVAKSAFGVGAAQNGANAENMASFSTRGPTADGRIKPEVVAPGDCLTSSYLSAVNSYACLSGTSMSTPSVSGAATLVRDYLAKGYYPAGTAGSGPSLNPSTALVRAMLVNSGKEMMGTNSHPAPYYPWLPVPPNPTLNNALNTAGLGASFPNGGQGYGRVTLDDVLHFAGDARKLWFADEGAGLATGGVQTFTVTVTDSTQPLEVTLAWSDYPGAANANPAIVNDLDLVVVAPTGLAYAGNVLVNGESVPLAFKDKINVQEAFMLKAPTAGTYTITVTGASVPQGPQPFALVVTGGI